MKETFTDKHTNIRETCTRKKCSFTNMHTKKLIPFNTTIGACTRSLLNILQIIIPIAILPQSQSEQALSAAPPTIMQGFWAPMRTCTTPLGRPELEHKILMEQRKVCIAGCRGQLCSFQSTLFHKLRGFTDCHNVERGYSCHFSVDLFATLEVRCQTS